MRFLKKTKDVSETAVELHSEIFMRSSIEGIRGFYEVKPQDSYFIKMLSRVIQSMRSGSPSFFYKTWTLLYIFIDKIFYITAFDFIMTFFSLCDIMER